MSTLTEKNQEHFNKVATTHQAEFAELFIRVTKLLHDNRHWISNFWTDTEASKDKPIKLLDYACGAGTISKAFEPFVTKVVGLDLSENMVKEYNKGVVERGISPEKMFAIHANLLADDKNALPEQLSTPEFYDFDVVAIGMALHHVDKPGLLLKKLAGRLRKGGVCLVLDHRKYQANMTEEMESSEAHQDVWDTVHKKDGYNEEEIRSLYEEAGLNKGFNYKALEEPFKFVIQGKEYEAYGFLARGELP